MQKFIITTPDDLKYLIKEVLAEQTKEAERTISKETQYDSKYFTRKEVSEMLSISLPTLTKYVKQGKIDCHKVGARVLFKKEDISKAIQKRNFN